MVSLVMSVSQKSDRLSEAQVKLSIGDWLTDRRLQVFDEGPNRDRPQWGAFEVWGINRGKKPDLVVCGDLAAARTVRRDAYVAVEIKRGYKHRDILDGFDAILDYFSDYLWGAQYTVSGQVVEIAAFTFATLFSQQGFLFEGEGKFDPRGIVRGPWDAYPMTFTISRLLWRQKDNLVKRFQSLSGIPRVERSVGEGKVLLAGRAIPEIGILVRNPSDKDAVRLMLSKHPYHWRFEGQREVL